MTVIAITGFVGQGKTVFLSYLAHKISSERKMPIYANYPLKDSKSVNDLCGNKGVILAIDEANFSEMSYENQKENILIVTAQDVKKLNLAESAMVVTVARKEDKIISSLGDEILLKEYLHLNLSDKK